MIDCASFEAELAGAWTADRLAALRAHASGCAKCRGSLELLRLGERVPEPDAAYWEGFDARLHRRLELEAARGAPVARRRWVWAAAALLAAFAGGTWWRWQSAPPVVVARGPELPAFEPAPADERMADEGT
ncbi:MAG TPA: hypothetical protein VJS92_13645 [Candidatus Polarisedimenticolaceae bacterium]|nr:hypothetical protein [Candidatus Polarisedimenticolaceae bacterium]